MSKLQAALSRLREHPGVEQLILLGRDGLVVQQLGAPPGEEEPVAARVPGLASACEALGSAAGLGSLRTSVLEFDEGVLVVVTLSRDLLLASVLRPGVGFAPLLREMRAARNTLPELI